MEDRTITGAQGLQAGWRGQQAVGSMDLPRRLITSLGPAECLPLGDCEGRTGGHDNRAVRKLEEGSGQSVNTLAPVLYSLPMQHRVDVRRGEFFRSHRSSPGGAKRTGRFAPAEEAGAMTRG